MSDINLPTQDQMSAQELTREVLIADEDGRAFLWRC